MKTAKDAIIRRFEIDSKFGINYSDFKKQLESELVKHILRKDKIKEEMDLLLSDINFLLADINEIREYLDPMFDEEELLEWKISGIKDFLTDVQLEKELLKGAKISDEDNNRI
jgi:hypothetical protein